MDDRWITLQIDDGCTDRRSAQYTAETINPPHSPVHPSSIVYRLKTSFLEEMLNSAK